MAWLWNRKCESETRLDEKTVIVTGSNTGIGKVTALELVRRGARVILACRNIEKARDAKKDIEETLSGYKGAGEAVVRELNLSSFTSVRKFAEEILKSEKAVNILINNAGVMGRREISEDGFELTFATNYLGHFLLTLLLLPRMKESAPARIINVSSMLHAKCTSISFEDINMEASYTPMQAYCRSKLANILFTKSLAKRLRGTGITVYSLHPGTIKTDILRDIDEMVFTGAGFLTNIFTSIFFKSPEQGAQTTLYCALDENLKDKSGLYYDDCQEASPSDTAQDEVLAESLWEKSLQYVQLNDTFGDIFFKE